MGGGGGGGGWEQTSLGLYHDFQPIFHVFLKGYLDLFDPCNYFQIGISNIKDEKLSVIGPCTVTKPEKQAVMRIN